MRPLREALALACFESLANTGRGSALAKELLSGFVSAAVEQSLHHLRTLKDQRLAEIRSRLDEEERRLRNWFQRWCTRMADEHFTTLLRAENLDSLPKYLAERVWSGGRTA